MTTANGKKRPVRVFLDGQDYSTLLIQAGTHQVTPSVMGEMLMQDGLKRLQRGDYAALGLCTEEPASQGSGS
ncbi:hypothetical protein BOX17_11680 [Halomonas aestuarii]|uniref:Uncharacterized protein n=1 Tax=Halomonas aestuarii TaxID=1897729 RepID=A0A1J0VHN2_9GAMM|nr:hypothetical protein [Halomonas aestuarii]APE31548.1 hypothetical protein BOX17_11680 [Halomonas aestuarii]